MLDIDRLRDIVKSKDTKKIRDYMKKHNLYVENGKIIIPEDNLTEAKEYWDRQQHSIKIFINSLKRRAHLVATPN
jgi:hypothetical protein